jgi:ATP-binding cassette subfamily C protein
MTSGGGATRVGLRLIARHRALAALAVAGSVLTAADLGLRPVLTKALVHASVTAPDRAAAWRIVVVIALVAAVGVAVAYQSPVRLAALTERVLRDLRVSVFRHVLAEEIGDASALGRVVNDTDVAAHQLASVIPLGVGALLNVMAVTVAMVVVDARVIACVLGVLGLVFVPLVLVYRRRATATMTGFLESYDRYAAAMAESAAGSSVAWRFGRRSLVERFDPVNEQLGRDYQRVFVLSARFTGALTALRGVSYAVATAATILLVPAPDRVPVLAAFVVALPTLFGALELLAQIVDTVTIGAAALARLGGIELGPLDERVPSHPDTPRAPGIVSAVGLTRRYDSFMLGPATFDIGPGTTAIVGATGAGKTTLARLLAGLDRPSAGTVTVDGDEPASRRHEGTVVALPQNPRPFPGTVADNLLLARPGASSDDLARFVVTVGLGDWLQHLRHGLHTAVDDTMSDGDQQIVSLLQLLLLDPAVVVLDEPTASLDALTSSRVERAAALAFAGRTVVLVTHNLATAQRADRILVMQDGAVVGDGTHEELLASSPPYRELTAVA